MTAGKTAARSGETGVFCFLGPELGEKLDALGVLRSGLPPHTEETSFYAGETSLQEIVSVLRNGSLFSDERLFIIKSAELIKKKDDVELLVSCIRQPPKNTAIVLVSEEIRLDKRIEDAVPKEHKTIFWELFENKKTEWLASFFRREGRRIDDSGIETILEMVENNTDALRRECRRLILFLDKDKTITGADVERCLSHVREESAFTLFAAIARGNLQSSLEIVRSLTGARESVQAITGTLAWCFRKLRDYLALRASGAANDFELKKIGLGSSKTRADYQEAAKRWPRAEGALALLGEYEYLFRSSGSAWEEILMDRLVMKLSGTGNISAANTIQQ
ncbi:MAG: DNA polymerase III subunit delta [Spirochaetaceae bacterium]|jgi:DNA polymerase-3 subunit delta|nr:DNA polymerase III subunit delta [Spirochaetaceae bacterium]